jgi:rSAM/selenodomain-associated transferase 1
VFAREPTPGRTKARLALGVGSATAAVLADAFLRDTLAKVTKLGVQLVIAGDTPHGVKKSPYFLRLARTYGAELNDQAGGDLGARMSGALRPYLENGAILIGSDAPSLPLGHLKRAFALLARRFDVVVGPTVDGGYYLVGARGALPEIFRDMPWGEETVFQETVRRLRAAENRYAVAPWWYDIDEEADLMMLAAHLFRRKSLGVRFNASMPLGRKCPCPTTAAMLARLGI